MRVIYIDSSAALKRTLPEREARQLAHAFADAGSAGHTLVTSTLARVEVSRALRRREHELAVSVSVGFQQAMQGIGQAPMTAVVAELARAMDPPLLRSLDAIHLATAVAVGADELWTYDARLAEAAGTAGMAVRFPA
jgi:predicted nucleic acid-binding protein